MFYGLIKPLHLHSSSSKRSQNISALWISFIFDFGARKRKNNVHFRTRKYYFILKCSHRVYEDKVQVPVSSSYLTSCTKMCHERLKELQHRLRKSCMFRVVLKYRFMFQVWFSKMFLMFKWTSGAPFDRYNRVQ